AQITDQTSQVQKRVEAIDSILSNIDFFKKTIEMTKVLVGLTKQEQANLEHSLSGQLGVQQISVDLVDAKLIELNKSLEDIRNRIVTAATKLSSLSDQLLKFQQAAEYHKLNRYLTKSDE